MLPGPRGIVLTFRAPSRGLSRAQRLKRLGRAGLAWIGLWAVLLAGSALAAFMADAPSKSEEKQRPPEPAALGSGSGLVSPR